MNEKYLAINAGSSSLKFSLSYMPAGEEIVNGVVERIGQVDSFYTLKFNGQKMEKRQLVNDHTDAVRLMINELLKNQFILDINEIKGVGHRVIHGGELFSESVHITETVLEQIKGFINLAPLHLPGEVVGIEAVSLVMPDVPQVAVFDTSFHLTMPQENYMYGTPYSWYEEMGVRKYGFHGTSHKYITEYMQEKLDKKDVNLIICHIGGGASLSCIKAGICQNTTMGMTPLDGLIMGTRSGSIDPAIIEFVCKEKNISVEEVTASLLFESGLLGLTGKSDYRDVEALVKHGDPKARLALTMFEKSIVKYIAQYFFELNGQLDALVFTAGIGENGILLREEIVSLLEGPMNIHLNKELNDNLSRRHEYQNGKISTNDSSFEVLVIPTNEEYMILKDTYNIRTQLREEDINRTLKPKYYSEKNN